MIKVDHLHRLELCISERKGEAVRRKGYPNKQIGGGECVLQWSCLTVGKDGKKD
jgi:hypothetical protein